MGVKLFDAGERALRRVARPDDRRFPYLNDSARPEAQRVRGLLELWFQDYPAEHRPRLRTDLRSHDDATHLAAYWELAVHALLRLHGLDVEVMRVRIRGVTS